MLGYFVLVILQLIAAWFGMPKAMTYLPANMGSMGVAAVEAAIYALIVWFVGVLCSFILKGVRTPGSTTLVASLIGALIGAAVVVFMPAIDLSLPREVPPRLVPLLGAVLGYLVRR